MRWYILLVSIPIIASLIATFVWKTVQNRRMDLRRHAIDSVIWRPGHRLTAESRQRFLEETKTSTRTGVEYVLYAAFLTGTFLAVMFYKASLTDSQLATFNVHVGVAYFGFMAWVFSRLNTIYHTRKLVRSPERTFTELSRMESETVPDRPQEMKHPRPVFGLTSIQLAILIVVFISAFTAFTWALKIIK